MPLPRIVAVCDGQTLGKSTIARLIHNVLPSPGSSLMCLGTCRQEYPFWDSALVSAYFDPNDSAALPRLMEIIRNHRVIVLDVDSATHPMIGGLLHNAKFLLALDELRAHAMILTPDDAFGSISVSRPSLEIMSWAPSLGVVLPALPSRVRESIQELGISLPAALGERRAHLDHHSREWLGIWEEECMPALLDLLERPHSILNRVMAQAV